MKLFFEIVNALNLYEMMLFFRGCGGGSFWCGGVSDIEVLHRVFSCCGVAFFFPLLFPVVSLMFGNKNFLVKSES